MLDPRCERCNDCLELINESSVDGMTFLKEKVIRCINCGHKWNPMLSYNKNNPPETTKSRAYHMIKKGLK